MTDSLFGSKLIVTFNHALVFSLHGTGGNGTLTEVMICKVHQTPVTSTAYLYKDTHLVPTLFIIHSFTHSLTHVAWIQSCDGASSVSAVLSAAAKIILTPLLSSKKAPVE
ncbi:hypothetical protein BHE74_00034210 [Ensete ventricosum]|nr:hypothetical protein BHE74_00034210 [Ensete ventricosum]